MNESKVIIVAGDGYEAEYAKKLHALISEKGINSVLWTESEYLSNRPKLGNKQRLIFFGLGKETKKQAAIISRWVFDKFACRIGWLNNICVITALDGALLEDGLAWGDLEEFSRYCKSKTNKHPDIVVPSTNASGEVWNVFKGIFSDTDNKSVWRAQYSMLVYEFLDNHISDFMGMVTNDEEA